MNHSSWLGFGINRNCISFVNSNDCVIGGFIYDTDYEDVNIFSEDFKDIRNPFLWMEYGLQRGWIEQIGCVIHELKRSNFVFNLQDLVPLKLGVIAPPLTHKPDNKDYFAYQRSTTDPVKYLFDAAKELIPCDSIIDIGCGMGEFLMMAKNYGYTDIHGVEVQKELVDIARKNIDANITLESAETFLLPDKQMHIYMFNPFSNKIMKQFLDNNIDNIIRNNSAILYNYTFIGEHLIPTYGLKQIFGNSFSKLYIPA